MTLLINVKVTIFDHKQTNITYVMRFIEKNFFFRTNFVN